MAIAALCAVPMETDGAGDVYITGETNIIKVNGSGTFESTYTNTDYDDTEKYTDVIHDVSYEAKLVNGDGETQTNGVSPSRGDTTLGEINTLTVKAPADDGRYRLVVEYTDKISYKEGGESKDIEVVDTKEYIIRIVEPIVLSVTIDIPEETNVDLKAYGVYFVVDGVQKDDSYTTFSTDANGTATATYELVAILGGGKHTFSVVPADGEMVTIAGLDETYTFYIGDNDYTTYIALSIVFVIVMILVLVWILRKPVRNYGKPKARRK